MWGEQSSNKDPDPGSVIQQLGAQDFPGSPVGKNLPANARGMDSISSPGRSHIAWGNSASGPQLLKPMGLEPMLCNKRSQGNEKPGYSNYDR